MPLLIGSQTQPVTPSGPGPSAVIEDIGTINATWTDPEGAVWELSNTADNLGWFTVPGIAGWGARPYEFVVDALPRGGDRLRFIRGDSARMTWPLYIFGDTHQQFVARYRAIKRAFLLTAWRGQPGVLRVARPDGSARLVECFYEDGFTGGGSSAGPAEDWMSANPVLTLVALDGWWRAETPVTVQRFYSTQASFFTPFPTVSSSQVLGSTQITNPGDVEAWPSWTIVGPMTQLVATNNTLGVQFMLTYTLTAGQTITITTDRPTVRGPSGQVLTSALGWPTSAYLWPLEAGANNVTLAVSGAAAGSSISMSYYPRYEGA